MRRFALIACAMVSCVASPLPSPPPVASVQEPPPPVAPARWYETGWSNEGVLLPEGRLVLLRGERALVEAGGKVTRERARSSELLRGLVLVPTARGKTVVGYGSSGVYRFDDPLGPGVLLGAAREIETAGTAPGRVYVRSADGWWWLDLEGNVSTFGPPLDVQWSEFIDSRAGMMCLPWIGVVTTPDGGATWTPVADLPDCVGLRQATHSSSDGFLCVNPTPVGARHAGPPAAEIRVDAVTGRTTPFSAGPEAALVRWLRATQTDPLEAVALAGAKTGDRRAAVLGAGLVMEVDLDTGLPVATMDVSRIAPGMFDDPGLWTGAGVEGGVLFHSGAFKLNRGRPPEVPDARWALEIGLPIGGKAPRVLPALPSQSVVSVSGRGTVYAASPSAGAEEAGEHVWARRADGAWTTFSAPRFDAFVGLASGGFLLGRAARDEIVFEQVSASGERTPWDRVALANVHEVVWIDEVDASTIFAVVALADSSTVSLRLERGRAPVVKHLDASGFRAGFGRAAAVTGNGHLLVTVDDGATWDDLPTPATEYGFMSGARISAMGLVAFDTFRIGWSREQAEIDTLRRPKVQSTLGAEGAGWSLDCEAMGTKRAAPPLGQSASVRSRRDHQGEGALTEPTKGRVRMWSFEWLDGSEVPPKVRSAKTVAPIGGENPTSLKLVASSDDALFLVRAQKSYWVRVLGARVDVEPADEFMTEIEDAVGPGGAAWVTSDAVWGWPKGGRPRVLARKSAGRAALTAPERGRVALWAGDQVNVATTSLPIAPPSGAEPPLLTVASFEARPIPLRSLGAMPRCDAGSKGARLRLKPNADGAVTTPFISGPAVAPPLVSRARESVFTVRVDDKAACVEGVQVRVGNAFVRVNLVTGRAEGGPLDGPVTDLSCKLGP